MWKQDIGSIWGSRTEAMQKNFFELTGGRKSQK